MGSASERQELSPPQGGAADTVLLLLETLPDCVALSDAQGNFLWINAHWTETFGYALDELKGTPILTHVHPDDRASTIGILSQLRGGKGLMRMENRLLTKDGRTLNFEWTGRANADGTILGIARDVTDRKQLFQELQHRASLLDMVEELGEIGMWKADLRTRTIEWSPQLYRIYGVDPATFTPNMETNLQFYPPADREKVVTIMEHALATHEPFRFDLDLTRSDGTLRTVQTVGRVESDEYGAVALVGVLRDVTEERARESCLEEARSRAQSASQAKSQFLANMSHELRTPMNGVVGMADLLSGTDLSSTQQEFVTHIQDSAKALIDILNDILDLSKLEAGHLHFENRPFNVEELAQNVTLTLASIAEAKGVTLLLHVAADLAEKHSGDAVRVRQVLMNLLANAIKFTERGYVELSVQQLPDGLRLQVQDTGIGIPQERFGAIFERFSQADASTTRNFGGTGLGLTICKQIVDGMGGSLTVNSAVGKGSTFTVLLPLPSLPSLHVPPSSSEPKQCVVWLSQERPRALLARTLLEASHDVQLSTGDERELQRFLEQSAAACTVFADAELLDSNIVNRMKFHGHQIVAIAPYFSSRESFEFSVDDMLRRPIFRTHVLACLAVQPPASNAAAAPQSQPASHTLMRSLSVLLAEDNPINARVATRVLESLGHQVTLVVNGNEAVERWQSEAFDLVLMDVHMPTLDGLEATRKIRRLEEARRAHTPIIALTAISMKGDHERCLSAGMDGYLAKPLDFAALRAVLLEIAGMSLSA